MKFPDITYLNGEIVKIKSIEINIRIDYQREPSCLTTSDGQLIYLLINQHPLREEINSYHEFNKMIYRSIINCKEISLNLKSSYEYWVGWDFEFKDYEQCTENERLLYLCEQNERLQDNFMETRTKRSKEYLNILNSSSHLNNLMFVESGNKDE